MLQQRLAVQPGERCWTAEGTAVFVDISGFTKLSERLARKGREGSEQIADAIGGSFESILLVAYENGASLLKFGGDSLLLWFDRSDHVVRGCRACVLMRRALRTAGRITIPGAQATLRMSQGVHSGRFHFFAAGTSHLELLTIGPAWTTVVAMEKAAKSGEILVSAQTAALLPSRCLGAERDGARLLVRDPAPSATALPLEPRPPLSPETLARCLPVTVRDHVVQGGGAPEHRPVTIAFVRMEGTDGFIAAHGEAALESAFHDVIGAVSAACEAQGVTLIASDVDSDGGKLILTAGAPTTSGDDEERMLLVLRAIADAKLPLPLRIGVHRGAVFAGDIGPFYRRTYTVMGDAVNLAARLMAKAEPGHIYATADVLDRSNTLFALTELPPFEVKGKAQPVRAWSVGRAVGSRTRQVTLQRWPLTGRDAELAVMREALAAARTGAGRLIEVVGEAGVGKTRLLQTLQDEAAGLRLLHAVCEAYSASTPYAVWTELLREFLDLGRDDADAVVEQRLREAVAAKAGELTPWLPLIGIAFGLGIAPTPEVEMLAEKNRLPKLHEVVSQFLAITMSNATLIEIENAHHMDGASAELLEYLCGQLDGRPWLIGIARRETGSRFEAPEMPAVARLKLEPLAASDALRLTQLATADDPLPRHVLEVIARRSGGNPQFLRDLLRFAIESGGIGGLPDSAEAAAMARIDLLAPEDRTLVRRAAVFGLTFHPRMLAWFADDRDDSLPGPATWERLHELFDEESDGYLRFRRALLRDAAYEGLPYKLRRQLHGTVAAHMEEEMDQPEEAADILSLHYLVAGEYLPAWRYASIAAKRAREAYAHIEAAGLYGRALEAGRRLGNIEDKELAAVYEAQAESWRLAAEFEKSYTAFAAARRLVTDDGLAQARLLLRSSYIEERLGRYRPSLRLATRARKLLDGLHSLEAERMAAETSAWSATVLQIEGRTDAAVLRAAKAVEEAEAAGEDDALGSAYFVLGWASAMRGKDDAEALYQRSLEAYRRSGNLIRQAVQLTNLGAVCCLEGRWDEAVTYYEGGRDASLKLGDTVNAALASINAAEILIDRGDFAQAEELLLDALPTWKAAKYRYYLGFSLSLLARLSLRTGRLDQALEHLEQAKANYVAVGAEREVPALDARIAECRLCKGDVDGALEVVRGMLGHRDANIRAYPLALLHRVHALALWRKGNRDGARSAMEESIATARNARDFFELTVASLALVELDRQQGREPAPDVVAEIRSLMERLTIQAVPAVLIAPQPS